MIERQKIPIEFVLGRHGPEHLGNVDVFMEKVRAQLQRGKQGKVLVFTEDASNPEFFSEVMTLGVEKGLTPVNVATTYDYLARHSRIPTDKERDDWQRIYWEKIHPFLRRQYTGLGELVEAYQNRIRFVPEANHEDELESNYEVFRQAEANGREATLLTALGKFSEAMPFFKACTVTHVNLSRVREKRAINKIDEELKVHTDLRAAVVQFGSIHGLIAYTLARRGYRVHITYPEREAGVYIFGPAAALERKMIIFPGKQVTDEDYLRALIGMTAERMLCSIKDAIGYTENTIAARAWDISKVLTNLQRINTFEHQVKDYGFFDACLIALGELTEAEASSIRFALQKRDFHRTLRMAVKRMARKFSFF